jgi:hypothetical protein
MENGVLQFVASKSKLVDGCWPDDKTGIILLSQLVVQNILDNPRHAFLEIPPAWIDVADATGLSTPDSFTILHPIITGPWLTLSDEYRKTAIEMFKGVIEQRTSPTGYAYRGGFFMEVLQGEDTRINTFITHHDGSKEARSYRITIKMETGLPEIASVTCEDGY